MRRVPHWLEDPAWAIGLGTLCALFGAMPGPGVLTYGRWLGPDVRFWILIALFVAGARIVERDDTRRQRERTELRTRAGLDRVRSTQGRGR